MFLHEMDDPASRYDVMMISSLADGIQALPSCLQERAIRMPRMHHANVISADPARHFSQ
jgi:hypothetical protein